LLPSHPGDRPLTFSAGSIGRDWTSSRRIWSAAIVAVGVVDTWGSRYSLNPDGISYVEMARHAVAGAPDGLINGYWSPAYPALIAPLLATVGRDWATAIPALHFVNFVLYVVAAALFFRLLHLIIADRAGSAAASATIPFGMAAFMLIAIKCIGLGLLTPDFGVFVAVLATAVCCFGIERSTHSWQWTAALGVVLGAGYWTKGILLPLNMLLLGFLFVVPPRTDRARIKIAAAALMFAIVSVPLIVMVSRRVGHPTIGEVGRLNYGWEVDGVTPFTGWTGDSAPQYGVPLHGPRVLAATPQTLEFGTPIHATYALWFDPSYWYAGVRVFVDASGQWRVLQQGLRDLVQIVGQLLGVATAGLLMLWLATVRGARRDQHSRLLLPLGVWSFAAAVVYALVHVEPRYLAGFAALGVLAALAAISRRESRRSLPVVTIAAVVVVCVSLVSNIIGNTGGFQPGYRPDYLNDAAAMRRLGVVAGDRVAMVGDAFEAYAAFAADAPITVQVVDSTGYWQLSTAARSDLDTRIASTGVKAILANNVPGAMTAEGWQILARPDSSNLGILSLVHR
jgi:hypothetical protein